MRPKHSSLYTEELLRDIFCQLRGLYYFCAMKLSINHDPMGKAIDDFFRLGKAKHKLIVHSSLFEDDEMPVDNLFRTECQMPRLERMALNLCQGRVLDVGAGAGCHTLALESRGLEVTSIDISKLSTQVRTMRGAKDARCADLLCDEFGKDFDTIILLMNGLGIAGRVEKLPTLLSRCKDLLAKGGKILADSSDLRYVFEEEDGTFDWDTADGYYGEVDFSMSYGACKGESFDWLYVDFDTLQRIAKECGLCAKKIAEGEHYDYLVEIRNE